MQLPSFDQFKEFIGITREKLAEPKAKPVEYIKRVWTADNAKKYAWYDAAELTGKIQNKDSKKENKEHKKATAFWQVGMALKPTEENLKKARGVLVEFVNKNSDLFTAFGPSVRLQFHPPFDLQLDSKSLNPTVRGNELCFYFTTDSDFREKDEYYKRIMLGIWAEFEKAGVEIYHPPLAVGEKAVDCADAIHTPFRHKPCTISRVNGGLEVLEVKSNDGIFDPLTGRISIDKPVIITENDVSHFGISAAAKAKVAKAQTDYEKLENKQNARAIFKHLYSRRTNPVPEGKSDRAFLNYEEFLTQIQGFNKRFDFKSQGVSPESVSFPMDIIRQMSDLVAQANEFFQKHKWQNYFALEGIADIEKEFERLSKLDTKDQFFGLQNIFKQMCEKVGKNTSALQAFYSVVAFLLPEEHRISALKDLEWNMKENYAELLAIYQKNQHLFPKIEPLTPLRLVR